MPKKTFDCKACDQNHERLISFKCTRNNAGDVIMSQIKANVEETLSEVQAVQNKGKFRSQRGLKRQLLVPKRGTLPTELHFKWY